MVGEEVSGNVARDRWRCDGFFLECLVFLALDAPSLQLLVKVELALVAQVSLGGLTFLFLASRGIFRAFRRSSSPEPGHLEDLGMTCRRAIQSLKPNTKGGAVLLLFSPTPSSQVGASLGMAATGHGRSLSFSLFLSLFKDDNLFYTTISYRALYYQTTLVQRRQFSEFRVSRFR